MENIEQFLTIQDIKALQPDTTQPNPIGFADHGRGGMTYLNAHMPVAFMALVEFCPTKGPRGRHKHLAKQESLYVISGTLKGRYWLKDQACAQKFIHPEGTLLTIYPGLFHVLESVQGPALALEFSPQPFDRQDHYYPED
jgi:mannose-6-phosphate isomerase-like protein (cupin superfamily)